jgi:hypothetical protein
MSHKNVLKNSYNSFLLLCFTLVFLLFFFLSDGLFYGFDSNETFSSIWHSYNFINFSFDLHKGLADETFSNITSAHSFIHTHQGNVPRLLGVLLILLGFESVQSHVVLTFLILGLPTFYFLIKLLHKISNSKEFAYISIIFLFTNYILFFQWLFVTYRIWYFYLIFSSIYFLIELNNKKLYKILFFVNLIFIFYFELIFALYLSILLFIYSLYLNNFSIKKVIKKYYIYLLAPIFSILVLSIQLILFYGYDAFIQDINYTFNTRNTSIKINDEIINFYNKYFIVYWHNFFNNNISFFKMYIRNDLTYIGLYFISITIYGFLIPINIYLSSLTNKFSLISKSTIFNKNFILKFCIIFLLVFINNFLIFYIHSSSLININFPIYLIFSLSLCVFIFYFIKRHNIIFFKFFIVYLVIILFSFGILFLKIYSEFSDSNLFEGSFFSVILILFVNFISFASMEKIPKINFKYKALFYFFISFFISTILVYIISSGYLWSGYVERGAPFLIFSKFIIYGFSLFFIYIILLRGSLSEFFLLRLLVYIITFSIIFVWFYNQFYLIKKFKFNNFDFLQIIKEEKYRGKKIISNFYPASYSYISKSTGYQDDKLTDRLIINSDDHFYLTFNDKYLWLRGSKEAYSKPDFLICSTNFIYAINNQSYKNACSNFDLIKNINDYEFANIIEARFFADSNNQSYRWVIVEFDYTKNFGGLRFVK